MNLAGIQNAAKLESLTVYSAGVATGLERLEKLEQLKTLYVGFDGGRPDQLAAAGFLIGRLRELGLSDCDLSSSAEVVEPLFQGLHRLSLRNCRLGRETCQAVANTRLAGLDLSSCLDADGFRFVREMSSLQSVFIDAVAAKDLRFLASSSIEQLHIYGSGGRVDLSPLDLHRGPLLRVYVSRFVKIDGKSALDSSRIKVIRW